MSIDQIIKNRKTQKVLADTPWNTKTSETELHQTINELLDLAAHAPYHKKCDDHHIAGDLKSCLPWRFYVLDTQNCRLLLQYIEDNNIKSGNIANMLASAEAMLLVTWLPDTSENFEKSNQSEAVPFEGNIQNMEHIAAASAAIQNVLLGATDREIPNYWSSGGVLRLQTLRDYLQISLSEVLLGALFLFPKDSEQRDDVTIKLGQMRDQGKEKEDWSKWIKLSSS